MGINTKVVDAHGAGQNQKVPDIPRHRPDKLTIRYESYCRFSKKIKHKSCHCIKEEHENSKKNRQGAIQI